MVAMDRYHGGSTSEAPASIVFRNRLYLFARGNATDVIWYNSMNTNGTWAGWQQVPGSHTIVASPAVAVMNDKLVLYQVHSNGYIYLSQMSADGSWTGWWAFNTPGLELQTNAGVSATVFRNRILLVAKGRHGSPWANTISYLFSAPGDPVTYESWQIAGGATSQKPQVAWGPTPNEFYITAKGFDTGVMFENRYTYDPIAQTGSFSGWSQSAGNSTHAPSVSTYYLGDWP